MIYIYKLIWIRHWQSLAYMKAYDSWIATSSNGRCNSRCESRCFPVALPWAEVAAGLTWLALCFAGIWSRHRPGHRPPLGGSMIVRWWDVGNHVLIRCCPGRTGHFCLIDSNSCYVEGPTFFLSKQCTAKIWNSAPTFINPDWCTWYDTAIVPILMYEDDCLL